jgi:uncharacterized protein YfaQ (DUF2300 family)
MGVTLKILAEQDDQETPKSADHFLQVYEWLLHNEPPAMDQLTSPSF